jgi:hypothetical protein
LKQVGVLGVEVQSEQTVPSAPHPLVVVPAAQVPFEQQPTLHGCVAEQAVVQWCVLRSHAMPFWHSHWVLQPHSVTLSLQWGPLGESRQSVHRPPFTPQALSPPPATHLIDIASQQLPPLRVLQVVCCESPQMLSHWCVTRLQDCCGPQSATVLQPHEKFTQADPLVELMVQLEQVPPAPPQAVGSVPGAHRPLLQQLPLHGRLLVQ